MASKAKSTAAKVQPSILMASLVSKPVIDAEVRVGFVADNSLVSRGIGYFGAGFWAHMTNYVSTDTVIDARSDWTGKVPPGVHERPSSYLDVNPYYLELSLVCTPEQRAGWLEDLRDQDDKPYDKLGILDFLTGRAVDPNWRGKRAWFCDALGMWALEKRGIVRPLTTPVYRLTPGEAAMICLATAGCRIRRYRGDVVEEAIKAAGISLSAIQP